MTPLHAARRVRFLLALALAAALLPGAESHAAPRLLNAQQATFRTRPEYVRDHLAHIETLPFDGMVFSTRSGAKLMDGTALTQAEIRRDFAPLEGLVFQRLKHNFALVEVDRPADFFGDWSVTTENFRLLAKVLKELGVAGIFFNNEEDKRSLFNYPEDCDDRARSLREYQDKARARGRQIMRAIAREHPEIVVVAMHGPYSSFAGTPDGVRGGQTRWQSEELRGAFSAGLIEGLNGTARFVDGGEVYGYRTAEDFQASYDFRKYTIASDGADCPFLPPSVRAEWPLRVSVAYGVYNYPYAGRDMNPEVMQTTLINALRRGDDYVWLYFEDENWNAPGELAPGWMDAVVGAKAAASDPPYRPPPSVSLITPAVGSVFVPGVNLPLAARASTAVGAVRKVEFFDHSVKLAKLFDPPYTFTLVNPTVGSHRLTARVTDNLGVKTTSNAVAVEVAPGFSARINFQPRGLTPPVGYFADAGEVYDERGNGLSYGWNVLHTESMRDRGGNADRRLATLCQLRSGGAWEIAVPAGTYRVTVGIGDNDYPSTYTLNVEGLNYWNANHFAAGQFLEQTRLINVADGKLTVDQGEGNAEATRLNYMNLTAINAPEEVPRSVQPAVPASDGR